MATTNKILSFSQLDELVLNELTVGGYYERTSVEEIYAVLNKRRNVDISRRELVDSLNRLAESDKLKFHFCWQDDQLEILFGPKRQ